LCQNKPEKRVQRKVKDEPIDVHFSMANFKSGTAFLIENKTKKQYFEDIKFKLTNLRIEEPPDAPADPETQPLKIQCPPNQHVLIVLRAIDPKIAMSYSISNSFKLK
jgi:hypothetical protein